MCDMCVCVRERISLDLQFACFSLFYIFLIKRAMFIVSIKPTTLNLSGNIWDIVLCCVSIHKLLDEVIIMILK